MGIFKSRRLSPGDLSLSFGAIAFPIHVWAIINLLAILPAWLLRASIWDLAGAISYPLVEALLESSLLWIGLVLLSFVLPRKWLADKFVALSSILVWLLVAWAVLVQFIYEQIIRWGPEQIIPGLLLMAFSFALVTWLVQRNGSLEGWIKKLTQGLAVLTYFYIIFDLLGLVVIIIRNL
ncbi:MAG: hypothetical protein WCE68_00585 [Anaerolineales bacterium]